MESVYTAACVCFGTVLELFQLSCLFFELFRKGQDFSAIGDHADRVHLLDDGLVGQIIAHQVTYGKQSVFSQV
jgi:hypothetical protein